MKLSSVATAALLAVASVANGHMQPQPRKKPRKKPLVRHGNAPETQPGAREKASRGAPGNHSGPVEKGSRGAPRARPRPVEKGIRVRPREEDEYTSEIPNVSFSFHFDSNSDKLPCEIGCEGDYSQISAYKGDVIYEMYFLVKGKFAVAAGEINTLFTARIEKLKQDHPEVHTLILVHCPGSNNDHEMIPGGILVNQLGYNTCVPSNGETASGGTDFFVSGYNRFATKGAKIGIHSWADGDTEAKDLPRDHPDHKMYLDHYDKVCVPQQFYWDTLQTDYDGMYYITESDITNKYPWMRDCDGKCDLSATGSGGGGGGGGGGSCTDYPNWKDSEGDACDEWRSEGWCDDEADDPELTGTGGLMANLACCNCGVCKDFANWKDPDGDTCDDWRSEGWCAEDGALPELTGTGGLMASQACCNCEVSS